MDVHGLLDSIIGDGKPVQANRVQSLLSKMWNTAIDRGHVEANPCGRMAKPAPERARSTVLADDDLRTLWTALDAHSGDAADTIRLRLLTGQRGGEVHRMRWADVDLQAAVWTIPAEQAKNARAHRVPLTTPALDVLSRRHATRRPDVPRVFPRFSHQCKDLRGLARIHDGAYRWHDLRRTVATRLAALGVSEGTISRVLGHALLGVTATIYNQYQYDDEKRLALDQWAHALRDLVQPLQTI